MHMFQVGNIARAYCVSSIWLASFLLFCSGIAKVWSVGPSYLFSDIVISRGVHVLFGFTEIAIGVLVVTLANIAVARIVLA